MRKRGKILSVILSMSMVLGALLTGPAVSVRAEESGRAQEETLSLDADTNYAIIASNGKAIQALKADWGTTVKADGEYSAAANKAAENAIFQYRDQKFVSVALSTDETTISLRSENGGAAAGVFADERNDNNHLFTIIKTGDNQGKMKDYHGKYICLDDKSQLVRTEDSSAAEIFTFVKDVEVLNTSISIRNAETGKYVSLPADQENLKPVNVTAKTVGDAERFTANYRTCDNFTMDKDEVGQEINVVGLQSKANSSLTIISANWDGGAVDAIAAKAGNGGWESIVVWPNGDGTVSLRSSYSYRYVTVNDKEQLELCDKTAEELTAREKFIIETDLTPTPVTGITVSETKANSVTLTWNKVTDSMISGYEVYRCDTEEGLYEKIADTSSNSYVDSEVTASRTYYYKVAAVNGRGSEEANKLSGDFSDTISVTTLAGERPYAPVNVKITDQGDGKAEITWDASQSESEGKNISYVIYAAPSAYADYKEIAGSETTKTTYTAAYTTGAEGTKWQYYKVVAKDTDTGVMSDTTADDFVSLEKELFGENVIIFAPTDKTEKIDEVVQTIFKLQNSYTDDAQFNENRYAIYYKPGDYKAAKCLPVGFYTHIGGLGKTPYDVELNNIEVPAYLDGNPENGGNYWDGTGNGTWANATCNFWRSAENLSVTGTGESTVAADISASSQNWAKDKFNWAVAQAAPLRRVYSTREVQYDWCYGWASGGYVADCLFTGVNTENGNGAGTSSGQQFYTRNSVITGNAYGTTLNGFYQGVEAPNLPSSETAGWDELADGNGYTNWAYASADGGQQVTTSVTTTPIIREKPFLFLDDDGEYKIFKPALKENTRGTTWSEGNMGEGDIISLDEFYIAKEGDTAATINEQIAGGKNIFFTPGVYHAETPIQVSGEDTIVLGTGMASIIPDNDEAAMKVADDSGITIAGLIFDAGKGSKYLLQAGTEGEHNDHSANPTLLADLFFRIGGTTSELTKADIGLEINSDDVISDHFWIWRADHGAGVAWDGNESTNGLIVNGDDVTCYALFDEHFQEYNVLWNGENGSTYFFQNETCYDPQTQEGWMSHNGTVNGYSSYKVANGVENHYAVGLGVYNVFIYTGGENGQLGDSSKTAIQLDNAIEVPNSEGVIIENACIQTFAKADGALQKINSIINGVGQGVSSGIAEDGTKGEGWSRKFLRLYQNGTAVISKGIADGKYADVNETTETVTNVMALGDDDIDMEPLKNLYEASKDLKGADYTAESYAVFAEVMEAARNQLEADLKYAYQADFDEAYKKLDEAVKGLQPLKDDETDKPGTGDTNNGNDKPGTGDADNGNGKPGTDGTNNGNGKPGTGGTDNGSSKPGTGSAGTKTVKTGDTADARIYILLLCAGAAAAVTVAAKRRKSSR